MRVISWYLEALFLRRETNLNSLTIDQLESKEHKKVYVKFFPLKILYDTSINLDFYLTQLIDIFHNICQDFDNMFSCFVFCEISKAFYKRLSTVIFCLIKDKMPLREVFKWLNSKLSETKQNVYLNSCFSDGVPNGSSY